MANLTGDRRIATFKKKLTDYFPKNSLPWGTRPIGDAPATTFLREVVNISDSVNHCARRFTRKKNGSFTKDSLDSYQRLTMAAFALLMSHFETYQRAQFAELVNTLDFMDSIDDIQLAKGLEKEGCDLSIQRILAGRGDPREPGQIVADSLAGWHNPERVNRYFSIIFPKLRFYSNDIKGEIELLWQLRHSIVHTAGVITREDAAKVTALRGYSDLLLVLGEDFMPALARRFHIMLKLSLQGLEQEVRKVFQPSNSPEDDDDLIRNVVGFASPRQSWFRG